MVPLFLHLSTGKSSYTDTAVTLVLGILGVTTLMFQIEDTARKILTWLKKGINFWARVTVIRTKHRGNRYLAFCKKTP